MPYTPPSQHSPASSKASTPSISRNVSYSHDIASLSPTHNRPTLPRSISSATYLHKHRRSPSANSPTEQNFNNSAYKFNGGPRDAEMLSINGSLRQSPPPLNDLVIPTGAIISPPDSSENSDGDDQMTPRASRRRDVEHTWNELEQAVRSMSMKRDSSPTGEATRDNTKKTTSGTTQESTATSSAPVQSTTAHFPTRLSPEARKISHSRSSTDTGIQRLAVNGLLDPTPISDDDDDEDEFKGGKPPLVRKKSGELVKPALRPSSRRRYSSMPGTPTYNKSVHFNDDGNQTRHFLQVDKPSAVSAGSSPIEVYENETGFPFDNKKTKIEWDFKLANFPAEEDQLRKTKPIWIERFYLSADNKSLIGSVGIANISFHKTVVARFTLDYWKTTSEVSAEFSHDVRKIDLPDGYDRFTFTIRLADQANLETKTLLLCMRYNVIGQEHWDNNGDTNYQIDFVKKVTRAAPSPYTASPLGARPIHAIPRSKHSPPISRGRQRAPSIDDDMTLQMDSSYHFGSSARDLLGDETQPAIKLKPRNKRVAGFAPTSAQQGQGLGGRYDFGASLSAALSNAQDKLVNQSGLVSQQAAAGTNASRAPRDLTETAPKRKGQLHRPEAITTDRPAMGSAQYKDLVNKFCYFTPNAAVKLSPQTQTKKVATDGTVEHTENLQSGSNTSSPTRGLHSQLDGANDSPYFSAEASPFTSRSVSPTRVDHAANAHIGYSYHKEHMLATTTPTAIRG